MSKQSNATQSKSQPKASSESSTEVFTGLIMYPKLHKPDNYKGVERWSLDLLLNTEELARAKAMKMRIKKTNKKGEAPYGNLYDGYDGSFLRIDTRTTFKDGKAKSPPKILDENRKAVDPKAYAIGNGTLAKVKAFVQRDISQEDLVEFGGYKPYLNAIRIMKLVPYEGGGYEDDPDFIASESEESPSASKGSSNSSDDFDWENGDPPFDDDDSGQTIMTAG